MTETMMLAHAGRVIILKRPTPCASATSARLTVVTGRPTRTRSTSTASTPRLLGQRQLRATVCGRRGGKDFPSRHEDEHAGKHAQADQRLVCEQGIAHGRAAP